MYIMLQEGTKTIKLMSNARSLHKKTSSFETILSALNALTSSERVMLFEHYDYPFSAHQWVMEKINTLINK